MNLLAKNVMVNTVYYAVTVAILPASLLYLERRLGLRPSFYTSRVAAAICALGGVVLQAWCIAVFHRHGRGTPSPVVPTTALVTAGPYRRLRNPMNVGEVLLLLALALWFGSLALLVYALLSWVAFHAFIVNYEEPLLARKFGDSYMTYRARINRWLPR